MILKLLCIIILLLVTQVAVAFVSLTKQGSTRVSRDADTRLHFGEIGTKPDILYDVDVSNHGARCRMIIKAKGLEKFIDIENPSKLGGIKSPAYAAVNAQGKMPAYLCGNGYSIAESDTIARYILDKYKPLGGPTFIPITVPQRLLMEQIVRIHDTYISPIQGCMYRAMGSGFGRHIDDRKAALNDVLFQLDEIDKCLQRFELYFNLGDQDNKQMETTPPTAKLQVSDDSGGKKLQPYVRQQYLVGNEPTLADACLFPTMVFIDYMLPRFFPEHAHKIPPRLRTWFTFCSEDAGFFCTEIKEEITTALEKWEQSGRWEPIKEEVKQW